MRETDNSVCLTDEFLNRAKEITKGYDQACGSWSMDSQLLHIVSEVVEVKDVLRNKNAKYGHGHDHRLKILDEVADVFLTAVSLVNILEISNNELNQAVNKKLGVVEERLKLIKQQKGDSVD